MSIGRTASGCDAKRCWSCARRLIRVPSSATCDNEVAKLDPELPLSKVSTIRQAMDRSLVTDRLTNLLLAGFAATALLLALTGIYGVMSLNVANRTNEFGIRLALGAQRGNVLRMILGQGLRLAVVGVALGLIAAIGFTRLLKGLLFGVSASDPLTFAVIALLLVGVALLAAGLPARRATKVDPLRHSDLSELSASLECGGLTPLSIDDAGSRP